jgi:integrase
MEKEKKTKKATRYGIWQEETERLGRCWRFEIRVLEADGRWHRRSGSGFATKGEAEAAVAKLKLESRQRKFGIEPEKPVKPTTIGEAIVAYAKVLEAKWRTKHGDRYVKRNTGQITTLRNWAEFAGPKRLVSSLTRDDFIFYMEHESKRGLQASSIARHINAVRAALYHAIDTCPDLASFRLPRRPKLREANKQRMRILDEDEIKALSAALAANPEWRDAYDFFRVALGSGGRFDELMPVVERADMSSAGIRWIDVNEHFGTVILRAHKTGKERVLHIPGVVEVLMERKRAGLGNSVHCFTRRDHWIRAVFREASEQCGITYGQQVAGGWTVHDLRHTCLTHLLQEGTDLATVRDFAGHHSIQETTKYVHPTAASRRRAATASSSLVTLASQAGLSKTAVEDSGDAESIIDQKLKRAK